MLHKRAPRFFILLCAVLISGATSVAWAAPGTKPATKSAERPAKADESQRMNGEALYKATLADAEKGQPRAMLNVGILNEQGIGVPRNFTKALEWWQKAADAGEKEALLRVALCYEVGMGTKADMGKAVSNLQKAAELNYAPAQHRLAGFYLNGRGVPKDEAKGMDLLKKAAGAGDLTALFELGIVQRDGFFGQKAEPDKARATFRKAAAAGHAGAALAFAAMTREGKGGKAEPETALTWYLIAQKAGLRGEALEEVIKELKKPLSKKQIAEAESTANERIATWTAAAKQRESGGQPTAIAPSR